MPWQRPTRRPTTSLSPAEHEERHLYRIAATRALRLGEFPGPGLPALNLDAGLLATLDYRLPRAWSRWVFEAPTAPDGIRYPSHALPGGENTALFDNADNGPPFSSALG